MVFRHELPFDRSSLTRWRQRLGEEHIVALLQESLSVAHRTGAIDTKDLERVAIDTTVQEKAIAHPTDARLTHRAIEKLVELAKQFVLHAKALHGNPYDGHTLGPVIADLEKLTGVTVRCIHGDKGYRGHNYPNRFKVWISGQVRRVTKAIRREMRRRAAIEPVIGHLKEDHRMGRNYLTGRDGDRINAVLAAAGYNFGLLLRWFEELLRVLSLFLCHALLAVPLHLTRYREIFFTADEELPFHSDLDVDDRDYRHEIRVRPEELIRLRLPADVDRHDGAD